MKNKLVLNWWNSLSSAGKTRQCDINTHIIGFGRRWETLTDEEITTLYQIEDYPKYNPMAY